MRIVFLLRSKIFNKNLDLLNFVKISELVPDLIWTKEVRLELLW